MICLLDGDVGTVPSSRRKLRQCIEIRNRQQTRLTPMRRHAISGMRRHAACGVPHLSRQNQPASSPIVSRLHAHQSASPHSKRPRTILRARFHPIMRRRTKQRFGLIPSLAAALGDVRITGQTKMAVDIDLHSKEPFCMRIKMHYVTRLRMKEVRYVQPGIDGQTFTVGLCQV